MFPCTKFFCTFCQHFGPQIQSLMNRKNQRNGKKGIILLVAFLEWIMSLSKFLYPTLFNQMHYMNIAKHRCMHCLSMKEN